MNLQRFDVETGEFHSYFKPFQPTGINPAGVFILFVDRKGYLWVKNGRGLLRYDPYQNQFVEIHQSVPYLQDWSLPISFYEDREGNFWMGTLSRGVLKYAPSTDKFRVYPPTKKEQETTTAELALLRTIFEDSKGYIWKRTLAGTDRYEVDEHGGAGALHRRVL